MASIPVTTYVNEALQELNVYQPGATVDPNVFALCLSKLNQIFDNWNAFREGVWADQFLPFTLVPSLSPHTIGPTGTFVTAIRPVTLDSCYLNMNTQSPNVYEPIVIWNRQQYESLSVPSISTSIPTQVYYEQDWPNGKLFFYPIPNQNYAVRLSVRVLLAQVAQADSIDLPPGYRNAVTLTLSEDIATPLGKAVSDVTAGKARRARANVFANNTEAINLCLIDGQQPDRRPDWNYQSRSFNRP